MTDLTPLEQAQETVAAALRAFGWQPTPVDSIIVLLNKAIEILEKTDQ